MTTLARGGCVEPGCPARSTHRGRCHLHYLAYERQRGTSTARGYGAAWRKIRDAYIKAHPTCEDCGQAPSTEVDHVVSKRRGGRDHPSNLRALCGGCHRRKTIAMDGGFGR